VLISIEAAMQVLGLGSRGEIYRKINRGHLPSFPGPRGKLVERDGLEELWAKINRPKSKHPPRQPAQPAPRPAPAPRLDSPDDLDQGASPDYHVSHARAEYEKANLLELERKAKEGTLVYKEDIEIAYNAVLLQLTTKAGSLHKQIKADIPHLTHRELEKIERRIADVFEAVASHEFEELPE
jgi:hypothetical protein